MFTGIITSIGTVRSVAPRGDAAHPAPAPDLRVIIACDYDMAGVDLGASIACSGVCLTVADKGEDWFAVDVSGETRRVTAGDKWTQGSRLNLERALKVGDELGGHIVTGHVDAVGTVMSVEQAGDSLKYLIAAPAHLRDTISVKGSIAIDGVSLTVNEVKDRDEDCLFGVNIIPHTRDSTVLAGVGDHTNLEIDILARYLGRMMALRHS